MRNMEYVKIMSMNRFAILGKKRITAVISTCLCDKIVLNSFIIPYIQEKKREKIQLVYNDLGIRTMINNLKHNWNSVTVKWNRFKDK